MNSESFVEKILEAQKSGIETEKEQLEFYHTHRKLER